MNEPLRNRTLALAGLLQAARLAQQLAREGKTDNATFHSSIQSILLLDAPDTESVYGGVDGVVMGLKILSEKLTGRGATPLDIEIAKYGIALAHLAGQLPKYPAIQQAIHDGVNTIQSQMKFFEATTEAATETTHPRLIEKLAELYTQTISTLTPRILISGEQDHLAHPPTAAKVRAALLAGIRSAFLWRQLGGSRWSLLFMRQQIAGTAARILKNK